MISKLNWQGDVHIYVNHIYGNAIKILNDIANSENIINYTEFRYR
jgi:hypothetical protein